MAKEKKQKPRRKQQGTVPTKCPPRRCHFVHLSGSSRPPYTQFYQCTECGRRIST